MTKNKLKIILIIIISILILGLITTIIIKNNTDSNKFKREYEAYNNVPLTQEKGNYIKLNIQKNNQIKYLNDDNIIKEIQKGNPRVIFIHLSAVLPSNRPHPRRGRKCTPTLLHRPA